MIQSWDQNNFIFAWSSSYFGFNDMCLFYVFFSPDFCDLCRTVPYSRLDIFGATNVFFSRDVCVLCSTVPYSRLDIFGAT